MVLGFIKKMKNKLAISVVMATYNEPLEWIKESIDSILKQTFTGFEFIIINDNPGRIELQIFLEKYKKENKKIVLIGNDKNLGLTKSLNIGLRIAKGKYIVRMDADDIAVKSRFERQLQYLEKHKDVFLCATSAEYINDTKEHLKFSFPFYPTIILKLLLQKWKNKVIHPTIMFRNTRQYYYDEYFHYAQDYAFYLMLIKKGEKIVILQDVLLQYRQSPVSICVSKRKAQRRFAKNAQTKYA